MNRTITLAVAVLLAVPATSSAQASIEDLLRAHAKITGKSAASITWESGLWSSYNIAGWRAIRKGYYDTAEHEFMAAIKSAQAYANEDKDYRLLARSYADYAYAIQRQGRHAEAEPLLKWVLTVREAQLEPDSPPIAQTLNQLATLHYEIGRFADAEEHLKRAIASQGKAAKTNAQEHSRSHTLLGILLVTQRRFDEAEQPFRQALSIREGSRGSSHVDTGDAMSNLAWLYLQKGKEESARRLFVRALPIFERSRGTMDASVAHTLHGLAKIQANEGEQEEAEEKFLRAISIWDHMPTLDAQALVEVLTDYAAFLEKLGRAEDLVKIKARLSPLRAKLAIKDGKAGPWFRLPDHAPDMILGTQRIRG